MNGALAPIGMSDRSLSPLMDCTPAFGSAPGEEGLQDSPRRSIKQYFVSQLFDDFIFRNCNTMFRPINDVDKFTKEEMS